MQRRHAASPLEIQTVRVLPSAQPTRLQQVPPGLPRDFPADDPGLAPFVAERSPAADPQHRVLRRQCGSASRELVPPMRTLWQTFPHWLAAAAH